MNWQWTTREKLEMHRHDNVGVCVANQRQIRDWKDRSSIQIFHHVSSWKEETHRGLVGKYVCVSQRDVKEIPSPPYWWLSSRRGILPVKRLLLNTHTHCIPFFTHIHASGAARCWNSLHQTHTHWVTDTWCCHYTMRCVCRLVQSVAADAGIWECGYRRWTVGQVWAQSCQKPLFYINIQCLQVWLVYLFRVFIYIV